MSGMVIGSRLPVTASLICLLSAERSVPHALVLREVTFK